MRIMNRIEPMRRRNERGTAIVEAAIILPVFLTFLFAVFEAGRFMNAEQVVTNAAREAARYAVAPLSGTNGPISPAMTAADIDPIVQQYLSSAGFTGSVTIFDPNLLVQTGAIQTSYTHVRVEVPYTVLTMPVFNMLQINLSGEALMRNEASN
jgi:Flp pilus assembly protein TadG